MKKLLIIPGWTYSLDKYQALCDKLRKLDIEPVLLKVPGLSEPSDEAWAIDGYTDWLDKQLKGVEKPIVAGHSNGGRIALKYIQDNPGRIARLILIDSAGIPHNQRRSSLLKLAALRIVAKAGKILSFIPGLKQAFYKLIGAEDYYNAPPNMKATMQNMLAADQTIDLSKIKLPTTIIWGREDAVTPLSDGQKINAGIAGSKLEIVNDARHSPHANHPEQVAKLIAEAMKEGA